MKTFKQYILEYHQYLEEGSRGFGVLDGRTDPTLVVTYKNGETVKLEVGEKIVKTVGEFEKEFKNSIHFNRKNKKSEWVSAIPLKHKNEKSEETYYAVAFHKSEEEAKKYVAGYKNSNLKKKLAVSETKLKGNIESVGWLKSGSSVTVPQLKPTLFFSKKETWETEPILESYRNDLLAGINRLGGIFLDVHKQIMRNLVEKPDENCLRDTGYSKMSQVPYGEAFNKKLNNDFGECIGPIKIITDDNYMPWITSVTKIYVPKQSNYPFTDYSITDKYNIEHRISAKTAKGLGNTVKPGDVEKTIIDTFKAMKAKTKAKNGPDVPYAIRVFQGDKGKYKKEYELLLKLFQLGGKETKTIPNILTTAYLLVKEYGASDNSDFIDAYELVKKDFNKLPPYEVTTNGVKEKADYTRYKIGTKGISFSKSDEGDDKKTYPHVKSLMLAADKLIVQYSKPPYKINKALKLLTNLAFKDKVYYAKFAVTDNGDTIWEVRGRKTNYPDIYAGNKKTYGTTRYSLVYLDAKGARGKDKVGLRIESTGEFYDLETLFG